MLSKVDFIIIASAATFDNRFLNIDSPWGWVGTSSRYKFELCTGSYYSNRCLSMTLLTHTEQVVC